jgi:hypothetical protein
MTAVVGLPLLAMLQRESPKGSGLINSPPIGQARVHAEDVA